MWIVYVSDHFLHFHRSFTFLEIVLRPRYCIDIWKCNVFRKMTVSSYQRHCIFKYRCSILIVVRFPRNIKSSFSNLGHVSEKVPSFSFTNRPDMRSFFQMSCLLYYLNFQQNPTCQSVILTCGSHFLSIQRLHASRNASPLPSDSNFDCYKCHIIYRNTVGIAYITHHICGCVYVYKLDRANITNNMCYTVFR